MRNTCMRPDKACKVLLLRLASYKRAALATMDMKACNSTYELMDGNRAQHTSVRIDSLKNTFTVPCS